MPAAFVSTIFLRGDYNLSAPSFEDQSFDLIYAGSVFTHIDDLTVAWLLELQRILRPNGRLYITIHDKHTIQLLATTYRHTWLARFLARYPAYQTYAASNFAMFTILRSAASYVFYDIDYFIRLAQPMYTCLSVTQEAYGFQTALLFQRM